MLKGPTSVVFRFISNTATMLRRKIFIIVLIVCAMSFFFLGWHIRAKDFSNVIQATEFVEVEAQYPEIIKTVAVEIPTPSEPESNYTFDPSKFHLLLQRLRGNIKPNEDGLLYSGPTEMAEIARTPAYQNMLDPELLPSGPTEEYIGITASSLSDKKELLQNHSTKTEKSNFSETATAKTLNTTRAPKNLALILDTPGCKVPKFDPWDKTLKHLISTVSTYECPGPPLFMRPQPDGSISLNETILKEHYKATPDKIKCLYQRVIRLHEDKDGTRENNYKLGEMQLLRFNVPLNEDYVGVQCQLPKGKFEQYFPLVRLKKQIEEELNKRKPPEHKLNIILAGIDSISKLNFLRHFPRTHAFLKTKLSPFEMKGYVKVGDNTFPNLVPMLTGHFIEHYWNESVRDSYTFDNIDSIWKAYAKRGYRTFYAEDSPYTGTFQYLKRGFYDPPTDYYLRPVAMAVENSQLRKKSKSHCLNSQIETDFIYDYLRDFIKGMGPRPYVAFAMVSTMTHDYLNNAGYADDPTVRLLEDLLKNGALENSMLVLFSDHGLRFGKIRETYIGKFEERMPFMYIHFPKWFLEKYPKFAQNLRQNQERLMTLFDIHATMIHLLDLNQTVNNHTMPNITQGSSLLDELSPNRTCKEANILEHWCPCQNFEVVPFEDNSTKAAAQFLVDDINKKLTQFGDRCAVLKIDFLIDARLGQASDVIMRFVTHHNDVLNRQVVLGDKINTYGDYLITLQTKPGGAVFEGTVRYNFKDKLHSVLGISRINMYGNQSRCIDSQKMKIFCYCLKD